MHSRIGTLIWIIVATVVAVPLVLAANSPLLQWRDPVYIIAGFAGIFAMVLLVFQPLLASAYLPGISRLRSRYIHRIIGVTLVLSVLIHVGGLWITSPPDVLDALLFRSATSFSIWGVIAMWAVFVSAALAAIRNPLKMSPRTWKIAHRVLAATIVIGTTVHAILIDGTMETLSKYALCFFLLVVSVLTLSNMALSNMALSKVSDRPSR